MSALRKMLFGLHTIMWGARPPDMRGVLGFIASAGFAGVEFFQHPDFLSDSFGGAAEFGHAVREEYRLTPISFCSGTLEQRVAFCQESGIQPEYLYVDEWDDFIPKAVELGFRIAFHPHAYRFPAVEDLFQKYIGRETAYGWILDPAHFAVMGQDPLRFLGKYRDKLVAIHLKDWLPWYGRSYHGYAQGFCELGCGRVRLSEIIKFLVGPLDFAGWCVIEQDVPSSTPASTVSASVQFLSNQGLAQGVLRKVDARVDGSPVQPTRTTWNIKTNLVDVAHSSILAPQASRQFPSSLIERISGIVDCHLVTLWAYNPVPPSISLLSSFPSRPDVRWLPLDQAICGSVVRTKTIEIHDDIPDLPHLSGLRRQFQVKQIISVPIPNRFNPNDVALVVNLFPKQPVSREDEELVNALLVLTDHIAIAAERVLSDRCDRATGAIRELYLLESDRESFLKKCLNVIRDAVNAEGGSIFLRSQYVDRLVPVASTGIEWNRPDAQYYDRGQGRTGLAWSRNQEDISFRTHDSRQPQPFSWEKCSRIPNDSSVIVPLRDYAGEAVGIVRCRNKVSPNFPDGASFSQEDVTLLQAICDAIFPRLALFDSEDRVLRMFARVTHELKTPVVAVNSDLDFIEDECTRSGMTFREPYIDEAREVTALMDLLIENAEVALHELDRELPAENAQLVLLMADIVAPLVDQMSALLRRHRLPRHSIVYQPTMLRHAVRWDDIPRLWIRPSAIRQVLFNLVNNAVKYRFKDSRNFGVSLLPRVAPTSGAPSHFAIDVVDYGPGVDDLDAEVIFEWGRRGRNIGSREVTGSGFGLAISRQIMRDHGGDLQLTNRRNPTCFTLLFPESLRRKSHWRNAIHS